MQRTGRTDLKHKLQRAVGTARSRPAATTPLASCLALFLALSLASCAVSSPLSVTSTGAGFQGDQRVAFATAEESANLKGQFAASVSKAFTAQGVALDADAPLIADISVSQSTASTGIVRGEGVKVEDPAEQNWLTRPREKRRFDKCDAQRLRATLVLYHRANGSLAYRGSGEATQCGFTASDLDSFAQALVADALAPSSR